MIASLVVTFLHDADRSSEVIQEILAKPQIEIGEYSNTSRRIPMTIDSPTPADLEDITQWVRDLPGVEFVDVIFVHFEATTP